LDERQNLFQSPIRLLESLLDPLQPLFDRFKPPKQIDEHLPEILVDHPFL